MSAFMGIVMPDRIEVLTDGACYNEEGTLLATRQKAVRIEAYPAVITGRGRGKVLRLITEAAQRIFSASESFDQGLLVLESALQKGCAEVEPFDLLIAGVNELDGPSLYCFRNRSDPYELEPFIMHRISTATVCGVTIADEHFKRVVAAGGFSKTGVQLMENLRQMKGSTPADYTDSGEERADYFVGGFCDLTTIKDGSVETIRLHTWSDQIGEKIEPASSANIVHVNPAMTRQQRRAMERAARKERA